MDGALLMYPWPDLEIDCDPPVHVGRSVECKICVLGIVLILITCYQSQVALNHVNCFLTAVLRIGRLVEDLVICSESRAYVVVLGVIPRLKLCLVYYDNAASVWKELENYYHRLNSLWREFDALTKLPKCVCEVKCSCGASTELVLHQQLMKLMQFLMGLDDCYQPIRSALLTRDPLPEVKDPLLLEKNPIGVFMNLLVFLSLKSMLLLLLGLNPNLNCKNYDKIGHTIDTYFEIVGFPTSSKRNNNSGKQSFNANMDVKVNDKQTSTSTSSGFTSEQIQKLLSLINDSPSSSIHANMAVRASFFNGNHLTVSTVGMFNVVETFNLNITVSHPNGTLTTISHVGNLKLTSNVVLYDVLVVPGYCVSLMSVNKLIRDNKMFVGFDKKKCYIQDLRREKILGTGSESAGLYLFDMVKDNSIGKSNVVMYFNVSKLLWHNRLGHPSDQVLFVLHQDLDISKSSTISVCEVCHRAK
ncbi:ribonuclease H-like domain-containing protein [Tanacetum coccineum]